MPGRRLRDAFELSRATSLPSKGWGFVSQCEGGNSDVYRVGGQVRKRYGRELQ